MPDNTDSQLDISFVIPCYNSAGTIADVTAQILAAMSQRPAYSFEIILVNDNCRDATFAVIEKLAGEYPCVKGICLSRNFGQHGAILAGLAQSRGALALMADDDGQTPLDELFKLIDKLEEGYDVVFASYGHKKHSAFRNFGTAVNLWMARLLIGRPKDIFLSSFFVVRRFIVDEMLRYSNPYPYIAGLILRATRNIANVEVTHRERMAGESNYTFFKLIKMWLNGFTAFSVKPLRFAIVAGVIFALFGFLLGAYTVVHRLLNPAVPLGYSSMMAVQLFTGGMIMLILGMAGEYIGRIYISLNNAPQYVVRETVNIEKE
ncbi:MAG: glycosyltransferase family 2 protein [Gracilibacteraceae bacterium]|jgi:undecaprenyl-phosphate 4-deoxy-4-formamido-L-arabinose transferase|nr:glycosyltransferase family 2 protein [Gracilibacteraceae bacterium]